MLALLAALAAACGPSSGDDGGGTETAGTGDSGDTAYGTYDGITIFEAAHRAPQRKDVALGYEPSDQ